MRSRAWIWLPMAPSRSTTRCRAKSRKSAMIEYARVRQLRRLRRRAGAPRRWRMAKRQLGAVQRIDVHAGSGPRRRGAGTARRRRWRRSCRASARSRRRPSNSALEPAGTPAPQPCEKRLIWVKLWIGMMPGTYSASIPAATRRSRKRRMLVGVEAVLRDQPGGAGIDLAAQIVEIGLGARRPRDGPPGSSRR